MNANPLPQRHCPFCRKMTDFVVVAPDNEPVPALASEDLLQCAGCHGISVTSNLLKRLAGLAVIAPFVGMTAGALGTAGWMTWTMVVSRAFDRDFALIAAGLAVAAIVAGTPALRTFIRLVSPRALLPVRRGRTVGG